MSITEKMIEKILSGKHSAKQLIQWYQNASNKNNSEIMKACELMLRRDFPSHASKIFGAKSQFAEDALNQTLVEILQDFDLSQNKHESHVKFGGSLKKGEMYIDNYISYKNDKDHAAWLAILQNSLDSELFVRFSSGIVGSQSGHIQQDFEFSKYEDAVTAYKRQLRQLIA